ncbi:MAG TPA: hypothetical protein VMT76_11890 [Puia sp.]|nr:hypothetical protein [Puia sp.]
MKRLVNFFVLFFLLIYKFSIAQIDAKWYATGPITGAVESVKDSSACISNLVSPREFSMMNKVRAQAEAIFKKFMDNDGWELNELYEEYDGKSYRAGNPPPGNTWPPHYFLMAYQLMVNSDSLKAWEAWNAEYGQKKIDEIHAMARAASDHEADINRYKDSAQHYMDEMTKYMSAHLPGLASANEKEKDAYGRQISFYQKEIDRFSAKQNFYNGSDSSEAKDEQQRKLSDIRFHDACLLEITIAVNAYHINPEGKFISEEHVPDIFLVRNYFNDEPDLLNKFDFYRRSKNFSLLLFGNWQRSPGNKQLYTATFALNKANTDHVSVKRIMSYEVQDIAIYLSGNKKAIHQFLKEADWNLLTQLVIKSS